MDFCSSSLSLTLTLLLTTWVLLVSQTSAQTCKTQSFKNKLFANCSDLPTLKAYLHYTYNSTNSSLSIAFMAPPAKTDGWVAWAINPTSTNMSGSQALIALKSSSGSLTVKQFNLVSYGNVTESRLSFDVWDSSAESDSSGNYVIFASVKVPNNATEVNQVWQAGPSVSNGMPARHDFTTDNLNAKGTLQLVADSTSSGSSGNASGNSTSGGGNKSFGYRASNVGFVNVFVGLFVVLIGSLFI